MKCGENSHMPRILIIHDDPQTTKVLRTALSSQGYSLRLAANGAEGMITVREWQPDLVVVDVSMPETNGTVLCGQIRDVSDVQILVLSVHYHEQTKIKTLDVGADDYITKPFSVQELHARVRAQLRRHSANQTEEKSSLIVGDFRIDVLNHTVHIRDQVVRLTPLQFDLLLCLAQHTGKVLSHRAILMDVWGRNDDRPENVRVHINQLRKKIEQPDGPEYIVTEPWIGYSFRPFGRDIL
jgi:two-component system KDP operon response regulator KdpE